MKLSELAKKLNLTSAELTEKLVKSGVEVKSASTVLDESVVEKVMGVKISNDKKEEKAKSDVHIIRRNVRVINTEGDKKEVEQITTNISGDIKKSHIVERAERSNSQVRTNSIDTNRQRNQFDRKPRFDKNRNTNIVITRNGQPVAKKEEEKELVKQPTPEVVKQVENINDNDNRNVRNNGYDRRDTQFNPRYPNRPHGERQNYSQDNARPAYNRDGNNQKPYNRDSVGGSRPYNRDNNGQRPYNRDNTNGGTSRPYNRDNNGGNSRPTYNRDGNNTQRPYNRDNNGQRPYNRDNTNGGYRGNRTGDNTSYQVNKFIKQASAIPTEQKEVREYNNINIDKKKYNDKPLVESKKDKLDKNKLREQHSRVSTSKLKGLEINSAGLMDLYERDSDSARKTARRNKKVKIEMKQTKIIPMTEVKLPEIMTVKEFAEALKKQSSEIIKKLFALGILATVNQDIDFDTAYLIAGEFGITATKEVKVTEEDILFDESEDEEKDLSPRPPIVVVMGHVDHGKTSLLDRLRSAHVVSGEAGGITQHIGAYKVEIKGREICFLDTPGHEAFTAMRARGAQVTDIAVIVVAADDGIKPQTIEAIDHAKAAGVSIVVAINKIDKPTANVDRVKQELLEIGLVPEEWGGDTICVPISAMTGEGIDNLLEMLLLVADMKDLKANKNKQAKGTILEARLDKTKGTTVSMLVQRGQLNIGDTIVVGDMVSKIRAMKDDKGRRVKSVGPSTPVEVLGLSHVPQTGDVFYEVENEKVAKQLIDKRKADVRNQLIRQGSKVTLDDLFGQIKEGKIKDLNVIIKADVQGSVEALKESLEKLSNDEVRVRVLHASTGGIKESDVTLASVSNAIIIGFNVRPESVAATQADKEKVDMRLYSVIYDAIDDVQTALKGMIPKKYKEVMLGTAEIRRIFKITGVGIVAGCYVKSGKIIRNQMVRIVRDSIVVLSVKIDNLKREKDEVKEVAEGYECGIKLEKFSDIKEGDILECYEMIEEKV
ncbi:MAG: translation initiation factor IF-2 [Clostridia bacterium]|nr:translation initiation factor IF-2 [Clostridia bacterium]